MRALLLLLLLLLLQNSTYDKHKENDYSNVTVIEIMKYICRVTHKK